MTPPGDPQVLDVLVVGGGPVGACVSALLARSACQGPPLRVGLLQSTRTVAPEPDESVPDARVLAFSRASERILEAAGAWARIRDHAWPYEHMRIWHAGIAPTSDAVLQFDAAHVVHPLAGQGVNLGLLDAAALAQLCVQARGTGEYLGAQRTLRAYERWRKGENQLMEFSIDAFNRVLAQGVGPVSALARRALALTNRSALLKRFFIGHALGQPPDLTAWESDRAWQRR